MVENRGKREYNHSKKWKSQHRLQKNSYTPDKIHRLTYARWEYVDPRKPEHWTAFNVSVHAPTTSNPYCSLLVSMSNAGGHCTFRAASLAQVRQLLIIPPEKIARLELAERVSLAQVAQLEREFQLLYDIRNLPEGAKLARTDTGEILDKLWNVDTK